MVDGQFAAQNECGISNDGLKRQVSFKSGFEKEWFKAQSKKKIQISDNLTSYDRAVLCASEICGTAILVFLGCLGCVQFPDKDQPAKELEICLAFGLGAMIAVQCFDHISGSHINPMVTVAAFVSGKIPLIQVPFYVFSQILGALGGFGLLVAITPTEWIDNKGPGVCSPGLTSGVKSYQGFLVEFSLSFLLVLVCCGIWDCKNSTKTDSTPLRVGLTISVLAIGGINYTGANMNPARSFAPAVINGDWNDHWLYWLGPLTAGIAAPLFYKFLFEKEPPNDEYDSSSKIVSVCQKV